MFGPKLKEVGIFSRDGEDSNSWLKDSLKLSPAVKNVETFYISNNRRSFTRDVSMCTFAILYHSKRRGRINVVNVTDSLYDEELEYLSQQLGKTNVIVVIDDVDDSSCSEKERIQSQQRNIKELATDLFLFSKEEKQSIGSTESARSYNDSPGLKKLKEIQSIIRDAPCPPRRRGRQQNMANPSTSRMRVSHGSNKVLPVQSQVPDKQSLEFLSFLKKRMLGPRRRIIGIFSRDNQSFFQWLVDHLLTLPSVKDVHICPISNTGSRDFKQAVSRCTFAILYHSKKRGRINITDVTDSLYDEELHYLSHELGKESVIVVADDLPDGSFEEKKEILDAQPVIGRLAQDLFVFGQQEKLQMGKIFQEPSEMKNKLCEMEKVIGGRGVGVTGLHWVFNWHGNSLMCVMVLFLTYMFIRKRRILRIRLIAVCSRITSSLHTQFPRVSRVLRSVLPTPV